MHSCTLCSFTCLTIRELTRHRSENHSTPDAVSIGGLCTSIVRAVHDNHLECPLPACSYRCVTRTPFSRHLVSHELKPYKRPPDDEIADPPSKKAKTTNVPNGKQLIVSFRCHDINLSSETISSGLANPQPTATYAKNKEIDVARGMLSKFCFIQVDDQPLLLQILTSFLLRILLGSIKVSIGSIVHGHSPHHFLRWFRNAQRSRL